MIFSPLKIKIRISVIKSPTGVILSSFLIKLVSSHSSPFVLLTNSRVNAANPKGTPTYRKIEKKRVSRGTENPLVIPSRNMPIGVYRIRISKSFIDT